MQQINLYQPILRRERRVFSAAAIAQACALVAAGLALIYGYGLLQVERLADERDRLEARVAEREARLQRLAREYPPRRRDPGLERRVAALERELAGKRRVVAGLRSGAFGSTEGLSPYLAALARRPVRGLWLRRLAVTGGGKALLLEGSALDPALVPRLVQTLGEEPAYAGRAFERLLIERPEDDPRRVDFRLLAGAGEAMGQGS